MNNLLRNPRKKKRKREIETKREVKLKDSSNKVLISLKLLIESAGG